MRSPARGHACRRAAPMWMQAAANDSAVAVSSARVRTAAVAARRRVASPRPDAIRPGFGPRRRRRDSPARTGRRGSGCALGALPSGACGTRRATNHPVSITGEGHEREGGCLDPVCDECSLAHPHGALARANGRPEGAGRRAPSRQTLDQRSVKPRLATAVRSPDTRSHKRTVAPMEYRSSVDSIGPPQVASTSLGRQGPTACHCHAKGRRGASPVLTHESAARPRAD